MVLFKLQKGGRDVDRHRYKALSGLLCRIRGRDPVLQRGILSALWNTPSQRASPRRHRTLIGGNRVTSIRQVVAFFGVQRHFFYLFL
jgi:hypothetical protein